jgi:hypothetical protein
VTGQSTSIESAGIPPAASRTAPLSWRRATAWTLGTAYLPLLAMCLYTLGWVSCSHCKVAVWKCAPIAPGLLVHTFTRGQLGLMHVPFAVGIVMMIAYTVLMLAGITAGHRHAGRGRTPLVIVLNLGAAWLAVTLFALIRA